MDHGPGVRLHPFCFGEPALVGVAVRRRVLNYCMSGRASSGASTCVLLFIPSEAFSAPFHISGSAVSRQRRAWRYLAPIFHVSRAVRAAVCKCMRRIYNTSMLEILILPGSSAAVARVHQDRASQAQLHAGDEHIGLHAT